MSEAAWAAVPDKPAGIPQPIERLSEERDFYAGHSWAVNAFPRIQDIPGLLKDEAALLGQSPSGWRFAEAAINLFLLACAVSDTVNDWLAGPRYNFSKINGVVPGASVALKPVKVALALAARARRWRTRRVEEWSGKWERTLDEFAEAIVAEASPGVSQAWESAAGLLALAQVRLPVDLATRRAKIPAAFRSQDLAHFDVLALAAKFAARFSDRSRPVLVLGCRTAGSYFAPLVRAYLKNAGYQDVDSVTMRPKQGATPKEAAKLARISAKSGLVAIIDEPVNTGATIIRLLEVLQQAGIHSGRVVALLPLHPTRRDWARQSGELAAARVAVIPLDPEESYKVRLLGGEAGPAVIRTYFQHNGLTVQSISEEQCLNAALDGLSEQKFHSRLKRVYEVQAVGKDGRSQIRYVLAKSVGWGWLSYHAFLAGDRLRRFVPPVLGLRDGILYTEWLPQRGAAVDGALPVSAAAEYIAARTRVVRLTEDPAPALAHTGQHKGLEELAGLLSRAHGSKMASVLRRPRILASLADMTSPLPTLVDGKMRPLEWVADGGSFVKADFEQHGQGKTELSVADPAYDIAETSLHWQLTPAEESQLVSRYMELSGDSTIRKRLFPFKLLAGSWAMDRALDNLKDPRLARRHAEFNKRYVEAFDFLTEHTAGYCGELCVQPDLLSWKPPVVVADVDGVLDKQIFGFPSTTAAGILALSLLHAHGFTLVLNTARSLAQIKRYAEVYGCVGGIAEYGSVAWDRLSGQERVLVSEIALAEVEQVRRALRAIPGVFLNDNYQHSIRAYLYEGGRTVPLPSIMIRDLLAALKADRLEVHQTYTDTAVIARETDKGRGMIELLSLAGAAGAETIAIGDSEPDLAMFQVASRSFAPGHISCRRTAQLLGCRVAKGGYQAGLLEIARRIVHGDGRQCATCRTVARTFEAHDDLFLGYLKIADRSRLSLLAGALFDPKSVQAFRE